MNPASPSRDDTVTTRCPRCDGTFTRVGRQAYCSHACRQAAYRARTSPPPHPPVLPRHTSRRAFTVYQCPECEQRYLGEQRCPECNLFCTSLGPGGACPHCDEPIAITDITTDLASRPRSRP